MKKISEKLLKFYLRIRYSETGATAVEYGIMIALIAAVIIGVVYTIGTQLQEGFQDVSDKLGGL